MRGDRIDTLREERTEVARKQALEQHKRRVLYQQCFETEAGRLVLLDMMQRSYLFSSSFTGNSQTYFNEGAREWALELMRVIPGLAGAVINAQLQAVERDLIKEENNNE